MISRLAILITLAAAASGCSTVFEPNDHQPKEPVASELVPKLEERMVAARAEARSLRDPVTGWLCYRDCDCTLWEGKYAAVECDVDLTKAEDPAHPGKFFRKPYDPNDLCADDDADWSDFSRDMGTGLVAGAWRCGNLGMLDRHAAYGRAHPAIVNRLPAWRMGEPVGDGRGIYPPAFIGRVEQTRVALGAPDTPARFWPDLYPRGLVDYAAHLQVMNIWQRGEVSTALRDGGGTPRPDVVDDAGSGPGDASALTLDVSGTMFDRLVEHHARDPRDPLFAGVLGTYTGDMLPALQACLADDWYAGEYVRCGDEPRRCQLAAWIFACDIVLRAYRKTTAID